eukprot:6190812-Pleurochrysis_carterae.AAC.2
MKKLTNSSWRRRGVHKEDNFQNVLMSAPQEKVYTQNQIIEKQRIDDFLNGERLSAKLPSHTQLLEEPSELELKLALLQLDMIRRNAGRTEVEKMRNANREDPWGQVESLFSGPTPATLAQWLKDKAEQPGLESWHDAPADIAQKQFTKEKVEQFMRLAFFDTLSSSNLLKCDHQYENQTREELRACGENEEGWKEFKTNALWHYLLHRRTAEAKPGDGAPKLFDAYKLGRAEARLATGQRLTSDTKESLDSVFMQILGVTRDADESTRARDAQTTDSATAPTQCRYSRYIAEVN